MRFDNTRNGLAPDPLDIGVDLSDQTRVVFTVASARREEADREEADELSSRGGRRGANGGGDVEGQGGESVVPIDRRQKEYAVVVAAIRTLSGVTGMVPVSKDEIARVVRDLRPLWGDRKVHHLLPEMERAGILDKSLSNRVAYFALTEKDAEKDGIGDGSDV
jgi:hypothetical protein